MNSTIKLSFTLVSLKTLSIFIVTFFTLSFSLYESTKVLELSPMQVDFSPHELSEDTLDCELNFIPTKRVSSYYPVHNPIYLLESTTFQTLKGFHQIFIIPPIF